MGNWVFGGGGGGKRDGEREKAFFGFVEEKE